MNEQVAPLTAEEEAELRRYYGSPAHANGPRHAGHAADDACRLLATLDAARLQGDPGLLRDKAQAVLDAADLMVDQNESPMWDDLPVELTDRLDALRVALAASSEGPTADKDSPSRPCPRCGRPDAERSCPDCYSEFATPTAPALDVERLARAMAWRRYGVLTTIPNPADVDDAKAVAAEYARLSSSAPTTEDEDR